MPRHLYLKKIVDAKTALNAAGYVPRNICVEAQNTSFYIEFSSGAAAGIVLIEGAADPNYAGTWALLATVNWVAGSRVHNVAVVGNHGSLRARISSAVTGGTVDVIALVNG